MVSRGAQVHWWQTIILNEHPPGSEDDYAKKSKSLHFCSYVILTQVDFTPVVPCAGQAGRLSLVDVRQILWCCWNPAQHPWCRLRPHHSGVITAGLHRICLTEQDSYDQLIHDRVLQVQRRPTGVHRHKWWYLSLMLWDAGQKWVNQFWFTKTHQMLPSGSLCNEAELNFCASETHQNCKHDCKSLIIFHKTRIARMWHSIIWAHRNHINWKWKLNCAKE